MTSKAALRVACGVAVVLALPLVAMQFTDEVVWTLWDFLLVGALLAIIGVAVELAVKRRGSLPLALGIAALGVAACFAGGAGDAPGLVLIGFVLIGAGSALGLRARKAADRAG
jgi:hypothetical protein